MNVFYKTFIKILQSWLENTCVGASFTIVLWAVASVPCQEHIKDKILTHVLTSNSYLYCSLVQCFVIPFEILNCIDIVVFISDAYSEPYQTSKMEFFAKIVNDLKSLAIFAKIFILDIWQDFCIRSTSHDIIVEIF